MSQRARSMKCATNRDLMESHLRLQEYTSRLERMVQAERQQASTDALTGLMNHRGALQALQASFEAAQASGSPFSLLMGDIDGFKLFNDTYGHVMGDDVLKLASDVARKAAEPMSGIACRYGGDEFLIVLPGLDRTSATAIANEITERLGRAEFRSDSESLVPVSMSLGVASFPADGDTVAKIVAAADAAMYSAKRRTEGGHESAVGTTDDTTFGVLDSLVQAIDVKDSYTKKHCDIVAEYAVKLAVRLNLPEESQRALRIAGLLHDIGKLAVPDEILKKPAPLNAEEYKVMQRHVTIGEVLIREVPQLKEVIQAVACHHERYDGTGYPRGLAGDEIPLIGRIIAIADSYSAMCLDRPYRKGMSHDRVLAEMVAGAGIQFDPGLTEVFVQMLLEEQLERGRTAAAVVRNSPFRQRGTENRGRSVCGSRIVPDPHIGLVVRRRAGACCASTWWQRRSSIRRPRRKRLRSTPSVSPCVCVEERTLSLHRIAFEFEREDGGVGIDRRAPARRS